MINNNNLLLLGHIENKIFVLSKFTNSQGKLLRLLELVDSLGITPTQDRSGTASVYMEFGFET